MVSSSAAATTVPARYEPAPERGSSLPLSGAGSGDVVAEPEPPTDEPPEVEAEVEAEVEDPEPEEHELKPGELPQIGPLVSAFSAAATSALSEDPEKEPEKEPDKQVSGEFDLSEFGQFVASFDLDKPSDDGKGESS